MPVNSINSGSVPAYGPLFANGPGSRSTSAVDTAIAAELNAKTTTLADGTQTTTIQTPTGPNVIEVKSKDGKTTLTEAGYAGIDSVNQFKAVLEQALLANGAELNGSNASSGTEAAGSGDSQSNVGSAIYSVLNQLGNGDASSSSLLDSWNSMMQGAGDSADTGASALQAFLQNETPGLVSGTVSLSA